MDQRRRKVCWVWLGVSLVILAIAVPLWRPMQRAWTCYQMHASGEREQAEILHKLDHDTLALRITRGSHAGEGCTAGTSGSLYQAAELGDVREVVYVDWKPGTCELASTLEASGHLLWLLTSLLAVLALGLLWLGIFLTRTFTQPGVPARRMQADAREVRCPACGKAMDEGYLPLLAGMHWRRPGEPVGMPHALRGLPGTVGWRGRPRLHAFRCTPCEILTFQYGEPR
jgi:hypothetical protein